MNQQALLKKINDFLQVPSVIDHEQLFLHYLATFCQGLGKEVVMKKRALIVNPKSTNKIILSAHADRNGLIVNENEDIVYSTYYEQTKLGHAVLTNEATFKKISDRLLGEEVYAYSTDGRKLMQGKVLSYEGDYEKKEVRFEVENAEPLKPGTPLSYVSSLKTEGDFISSQIDNVLCVAVICQLLEEGFDGTVIFTTREEIGMSWAPLGEYFSTIDMSEKEFLVLDVSPYKDEEIITKGYVVLRHQDDFGQYNTKISQKLEQCCREQEIPFEYKDERLRSKPLKSGKQRRLGATELGRLIVNSKGAFTGTTLQIPTLDFHTNHEKTSLTALQNYCRILETYLSK